MVMLLIVCVAALAIVSLLLLVVDRLRPRTFRFKATVTKWISLDVEIDSPQDASRPD